LSSAIGSWPAPLYRTGYAAVRLGVLPLFAGLATLTYAILIGVLAPDLRSPAATLNLTIVAFLVDGPVLTGYLPETDQHFHPLSWWDHVV
jgi:hypothetical protein